MQTNKLTTLLFFFLLVMTGCAATTSVRSGLEAYQRGDYATAIQVLKPYAEQGDVEAQWLLGATYANAKPPLKDLTAAEKWTRKAAEQGHVGAMVDMAKLNLFYKENKDEVAAASWYKKAAERGDAEAQFMTGLHYFSGEGGLAKDYVTAYMWWILSARQGHPLAQQMLEKSKDVISPEQIDEATQRAKAWKPIK